MIDVTLITGDGIGPEIAEATRKCIDASGAKINWQYAEAGEKCIETEGSPLPEKTLEAIKTTGIGLKAPVTTPVGKGFRSVNVALRQSLDLYACVRPSKSYKGIPSRYSDIDIVVVRENTEDLYAGIEFRREMYETIELINWLNRHSKKKLTDDTGISIKPISERCTDRIVRHAFEYARKNGRRKVTSVHKANIMKFSDGLWLEVSRAVAKDYSDIEFEDLIVDNMCQQLVMNPGNYDVLVMPNLYGDIVSDLCAGLVGGPGLAPGSNIGEKGAVFEATHGSAPTIAGQNKANPVAMILSGVMMLRHLEMTDCADKLENAVAAVIEEGRYVTADLIEAGSDRKPVGTTEMTEAIIAAMK